MKLHGWDTAFALDMAVANEALARGGGLVTDFEVDDPDGLGVRTRGTFGAWQLVEGGSGQLVRVLLPIVQGELELSHDGSRVDLAGTAFVASIALDLVPTDVPQEEVLRFQVTSAAPVGTDPVPGAVTPVRLDDPEHRLDDVANALLLAALADYLAVHADRLTYAFATVNLVPPQTDSWLTPVRSAFAYADRAGGGGTLVILSVTTPRPVVDLPRTVDPALLDAQHEAAFAFSQALLLQHVVMPALPAAFGHGATADAFLYDPGAAVIRNARTLRMASVRKGAIDYDPEVRTLRLGVAGSTLRGYYGGWCDLKAGISMTFEVEPSNTVVYDATTRSLVFEDDPSPRSTHDADIPWYWWFGGPLVRLIVEVVVQAIASGLAGSLTQAAGSLLSPARNPPTSIMWTATRDLQVAAARLDEDFVMQGDFTLTGAQALEARGAATG